MKAKEYAVQYHKMIDDNRTEQELVSWIINSFMMELKELSAKRGVKSVSAGLACYNEINTKWIAFTNLVPEFKRDGFEQYIKHAIPELWKVICDMRLDQAIRRRLHVR